MRLSWTGKTAMTAGKIYVTNYRMNYRTRIKIHAVCFDLAIRICRINTIQANGQLYSEMKVTNIEELVCWWCYGDWLTAIVQSVGSFCRSGGAGVKKIQAFCTNSNLCKVRRFNILSKIPQHRLSNSNMLKGNWCIENQNNLNAQSLVQ